MCGICCILFNSDSKKAHAEIDSTFLTRRGPDISGGYNLKINKQVSAQFQGYTLHFRGTLTQQPIHGSNGNLLLWNGEIFDGITVPSTQNDGHVLLELFDNCETDDELLRIISKVQGPWSFIYWQSASNKLWFGRDVFGRRCLLVHTSDDVFALSSVKCNKSHWQEVPSHGIYCISIVDSTLDLGINHVTLFPWVQSHHALGSILHIPSAGFNNQVCHCSSDQSKDRNCNYMKYFNKNLYEKVQEPEKLLLFDKQLLIGKFGIQPQFYEFCKDVPEENVQNMCHLLASKPNIADSMPTSNLEHSYFPPNVEHGDGGSTEVRLTPNSDSLKKDNAILCEETILHPSDFPSEIKQLLHCGLPGQMMIAGELLKVLGKAVKVRVECQSTCCDLCMKKAIESSRMKSKNVHRLDCAKNIKSNTDEGFVQDEASEKKYQHEDKTVSNIKCSHESCAKCENVLKEPTFSERNSVCEKRNKNKEASDQNVGCDVFESACASSIDVNCVKNHDEKPCGHARVAILFSGGIDSLVIAALADKYVPQEEPIDLLNVAFEQKLNPADKFKAGPSDPYAVPDRLTGLQGLTQLNKNRQWNFVEINVTLEELQKTSPNLPKRPT